MHFAQIPRFINKFNSRENPLQSITSLPHTWNLSFVYLIATPKMVIQKLSLTSLLLFLSVQLVAASEWVACDNFITRNIPGGLEAVNVAAQEHRAWLRNTSAHAKSTGPTRWKFEFATRLDKIRLPKCTDFHKFGTAFDEMKYFCAPEQQRKNCNVYSLGSNNQWEFEEQMYKDTECHMSTFDCTVNATIPLGIRDRTSFYKKCVGNPKQKILGEPLIRMTDLKALTNVDRIDYLKVDIEGFEWVVLRDMINAVKENPVAEKGLPLQLYLEFHLDRSPERVHYVGKRLQMFFEKLFEIGYMLMYVRNTVQTRNTDGLLVKVLCNPDVS